MSETNDQHSDTSSDLNWPIELHQQHDRVVFENVADQYVKGEAVTAFFTILHDVKVYPDEDQIGLLRVGSTNIKECLAYAPVQLNPSTASGATRHGTATFSSSLLPVTDDEFYQFCYIIKKTKNLGSSIPFQLNCALDDIDLLSNAPVGRSKGDGLIALADQDNDDFLVIHTKRNLTEEKMRQENRHLLDMNRRLESQKDEIQAKLEVLEAIRKEHINKINNDMQVLTASHKTAIDELTARQQSELNLRAQFDTCQSLCNQYQTDSLQHAERCRTLEDAHAKISNDAKHLRSQLAVTSQLTKDQATHIIDLERRLMQSNDISKTASQRQTALEQQLNDLRLTSEKHQVSMEGQLNAYLKKVAQQVDQIKALEESNNLLKEEINAINLLREEQSIENKEVKNELEALRSELDETNSRQEAYTILKNSFTEIEKRCVKHQKSEIEVKRQLGAYQDFVKDLQREIQDLTERLSAGAEAYKTLFRKYTMLERSIQTNHQEEKRNATNEEELVSVLRNTYENKLEEKTNSLSRASIDGEVRVCPMCYWEFPQDMAIKSKQEHIDQHFQ